MFAQYAGRRGGACLRQRLFGDSQFAERSAAGQLLDGAAIEVPGGEVHPAEGAVRIQAGINQAHAFEQFRPVDGRDQAHAGNDVTHADVRGALPLLRVLHRLLHRTALLLEPLVQPVERWICLRVLIAQAPGQLGGEDLR